jgi:hypothetical protein
VTATLRAARCPPGRSQHGYTGTTLEYDALLRLRTVRADNNGRERAARLLPPQGSAIWQLAARLIQAGLVRQSQKSSAFRVGFAADEHATFGFARVHGLALRVARAAGLTASVAAKRERIFGGEVAGSVALAAYVHTLAALALGEQRALLVALAPSAACAGDTALAAHAAVTVGDALDAFIGLAAIASAAFAVAAALAHGDTGVRAALQAANTSIVERCAGCHVAAGAALFQHGAGELSDEALATVCVFGALHTHTLLRLNLDGQVVERAMTGDAAQALRAIVARAARLPPFTEHVLVACHAALHAHIRDATESETAVCAPCAALPDAASALQRRYDACISMARIALHVRLAAIVEASQIHLAISSRGARFSERTARALERAAAASGKHQAADQLEPTPHCHSPVAHRVTPPSLWTRARWARDVPRASVRTAVAAHAGIVAVAWYATATQHAAAPLTAAAIQAAAAAIRGSSTRKAQLCAGRLFAARSGHAAFTAAAHTAVEAAAAAIGRLPAAVRCTALGRAALARHPSTTTLARAASPTLVLAPAAIGDQAAGTRRALDIGRTALARCDAAADLVLRAATAVQAVAACVADRAAAVGVTLRLVARATAAGDLRSAHLIVAALTAVDGLSAVVVLGTAVARRTRGRWTIAAPTHGSLPADFSRRARSAIVHLATAVDEAAALAPSLLAGLSQTTAIVYAASIASAASALDDSSAAIGERSAGTRELFTAERNALHALVIEALTVRTATAAVDRLTRTHGRDAAAFGALGRARSWCGFGLRRSDAAMLAAHAPGTTLTAVLRSATVIRGATAFVPERAAALRLTQRAATLENIADLPARTSAAIDRSTAAVRSKATAPWGGASAPLAASAAASLDITQLAGFAAAAVLSDTARICNRAALDLGFLAQVADRQAALTTALANPTAAAQSALQHGTAAVRHAAAHYRLRFAGLGDTAVRACVVIELDLHTTRIAPRVAGIRRHSGTSIALARKGIAAASGKQPAKHER